MRIVINTSYEAAGTKVCVDDLLPRLIAAGHSVERNKWQDYTGVDLALFMAPDSAVAEAKRLNPKIKTGIMDPKLTLPRQREEARAADFLLVSSLEQREAFLPYNKNIIIYYMFPDIPSREKRHENTPGRPIRISYHGNKLHLHCMQEVSDALDELSGVYSIEFRPIYNIQKLRRWTLRRPKKCPVNDIQWQEKTFYEDVAACDIGIVPSLIPMLRLPAEKATRLPADLVWNRTGYSPNDYILRFKNSTNPGRLYVFAQLGIPVVADFVPSHVEMVRDGHSGLLVGSKEGWKVALERLIKDAKLRQTMSDNLRVSINSTYSIEKNFQRFNNFIQDIVKA